MAARCGRGQAGERECGRKSSPQPAVPTPGHRPGPPPTPLLRSIITTVRGGWAQVKEGKELCVERGFPPSASSVS